MGWFTVEWTIKGERVLTEVSGIELPANINESEQHLQGVKNAVKNWNEYDAKAGNAHGFSEGAGGGSVAGSR